jgi:3-deoxy-manno-octulosonate cytidylyltransferase (CMP-KDO synthetase)
LKEKVLGVIPARLKSSRLPQKPLFPLLGKPLLHWVWNNAIQMDVFDELLIATDSLKIARICEAFGACVELTSKSHNSGTERVAEVVRKKKYRDYRLVINIQGDLPLLEESCLENVLFEMRDQSWDIGTCATAFRSADEWQDPSKVKLELDSDGQVECFFRNPSTGAQGNGKRYNKDESLRHIGAYIYTREALLKWASAPLDPSETLQGLEQLRAMKIGLTIGAVVVPEDEGSVDTIEDAKRIEKKLIKLKNLL